jgi:hypothetical protein
MSIDSSKGLRVQGFFELFVSPGEAFRRVSEKKGEQNHQAGNIQLGGFSFGWLPGIFEAFRSR